MPDRAEHLRARQHQLHRPAHQPGRQERQNLRTREERLRAEAAAEERAADEHVLRRDAEQPGEARGAMARPWLGVSIDRRSPSQEATMACGSIALWYCAGVS